MQDFGFVVKRFSTYSQKFSVISQKLGKINVVCDIKGLSERIWPGMLLSFNVSVFNNSLYIIKNSEILMSPVSAGDDSDVDLFWLHQILEYSYFFLSLNQPCELVFDCIYRANSLLIVKPLFDDRFKIIKQLFLVKLFTLFGMQPSNFITYYIKEFDRLVFTSVDFTNSRIINSLQDIIKTISEKDLEKIDLWLMQNLKLHHNFSSFKTVRFKNLIK